MQVWPLVPRNCPVCRYLTRFWSQYLASLCSWTNFTPCHPFHHFDFLNRCLPLPAFFCTRHKTGYLNWSRFFYMWRVCHCGNNACYSRQGKRSSPSHFRYLFLQCLSGTHLSDLGNLASLIKWRLRPLCRNCGQWYFLCNGHCQLLGQSLPDQYPWVSNHC